MKTSFIRILQQRREGQLLIEMLIAILVGGIFIVGATVSTILIIRYNFETRENQNAAMFGYEMMNGVESLAANGWRNIYDLQKGELHHYYLVPGPTSSQIVEGEESILFNDNRSSLTGHWKLDEAAGDVAYDSSGNSNNGQFLGIPGPARQESSYCSVGKCVTTDGYISVPSSTALSPHAGLSISLWINPSGSGMQELVVKNNDSNDGAGPYELFINDGYISLRLKKSGIPFLLTSANQVSQGSWHHISATWDGATMKIYIDGKEDPYSLALTDAIDTSQGTLTIGALQGGSALFDGKIDDIRIYKRALSQNEVTALFESQVYTRYFTVNEVAREGCGSGNITTSTANNCVGSPQIIADPSTQSITGTIAWGSNRKVLFEEVIARTDANHIDQIDWTDGEGVEGPVTSTLSGFSLGSNITVNSDRSFSLATTSESGWLISSIIDTGQETGVAMNSIAWRGSRPPSTNVRFQIAYANATSGPWVYVGNDGTSATYFAPASDYSEQVLKIHNYRYLRYKAYLDPANDTTPTVSSITINYSK